VEIAASDVPSDKRLSASQRRLAGQGPSPRELRRWALASVGLRRLTCARSGVQVPHRPLQISRAPRKVAGLSLFASLWTALWGRIEAEDQGEPGSAAGRVCRLWVT
jgi:hypothetical protein